MNYTPVKLPFGMSFYVCDDCGSLVGSTTKHDAWHTGLKQYMQSLTQVIFGDDNARGER